MADRWSIRPARVADVARITPIERRCFSDPWSVAAFEDVFRFPLGLSLVAERNGEIGGYLVARAVVGEGEIMNLAVAPEHRGAGLGRRLLEAGLTALAERGVHQVFLEVRAGNAAARALYQRQGFLPVGRRAGYYRNPVEDAIVLRLALPGGA
jgi:ribosomal-protein-alanine acetyltransferase